MGSSNVEMKDQMFHAILQKPDVFYRAQQRDEAEIELDEKRQILNDLFDSKPAVFLERYHSYINKEFIDCFPKTERCQPYIDLINARREDLSSNRLIRNRRFIAMQQLKNDGNYFSLGKMRERAPMLFDAFVSDHLEDSEKIQLRPTVDRPSNTFSNLMEQFDESYRLTERRKRHLDEYESTMNVDRTDRFIDHVSQRMQMEVDDEFEMEFDSDDELGRDAEIKRKRRLSRYIVDKELPENVLPESTPSTSTNVSSAADETTRQLSELRMVEKEVHPEDPTTSTNQMQGKLLETDSTGIEHDAMMDEFRTFMEQRFLNGEDDQFVDYHHIDNDESSQFSKWKNQDLEDAYFADGYVADTDDT